MFQKIFKKVKIFRELNKLLINLIDQIKMKFYQIWLIVKPLHLLFIKLISVFHFLMIVLFQLSIKVSKRIEKIQKIIVFNLVRLKMVLDINHQKLLVKNKIMIGYLKCLLMKISGRLIKFVKEFYKIKNLAWMFFSEFLFRNKQKNLN